MFDLPGLEGVEEVVISREVVEGTARPLYIYADRSTARSRAAPAPDRPISSLLDAPLGGCRRSGGLALRQRCRARVGPKLRAFP